MCATKQVSKVAMMRLLTASLLLTAGALAANAGIVYNQPWDGSGGAYTSQYDTNTSSNLATVYDDFTLASNTSVTSASWVGEYLNGSPGAISSFALTLWSDNAGQPGSALSTTVVSGNANESSLGTAGGYSIFQYSASFSSPFTAAAGTKYWLSVEPNLGYPPHWAWSTGTGGTYSAYQDSASGRSNLGTSMAFSLSGSPVPEMNTLLGFGGMLTTGGFALLRRRRK